MDKDYLKMKKFWDICPEQVAHIGERITQRTIKAFIKNVKPNVVFKDKSIIDYGVGGGGIADYIIRTNRIKRYIGIDISKRCIYAARKMMSKFPRKEFHIAPCDFEQFHVDLFLSLSTIQHFPSKDYLTLFLEQLESSGIPELFFQIRYAAKTAFKKHNYRNVQDVLASCKTNKTFIMKILTNYKLVYESKINPDSKYQYLRMEKNAF